MKRIILLVMILTMISIRVYCTEKKYEIVVKKDGWDLPKLEDFNLQGRRNKLPDVFTDQTIKNCSYQDYSPKSEMYITIDYYKEKYLLDKIRYLENYRYKYKITGLSVFFYKSSPFCYQFHIEYGGEMYYNQFLDIDLDGVFELNYTDDPLIYFMKLSPKVAEEDKYSKPLKIGKETIE